MRTLILLACVVVGCFAFQDMSALKRRLATPGTSEAIAQTVRIMYHTALKKRQVTRDFDPIQVAFDMTDTDGDGHITATEFADFYVTNMPSFSLTREEWETQFKHYVPRIDTNGNGMLEIHEYETLARMGGYDGK